MAKPKMRVVFLPNPPRPARDGYDARAQRALDKARETGMPQLLGIYDEPLVQETCWALPSNQIVVETLDLPLRHNAVEASAL